MRIKQGYRCMWNGFSPIKQLCTQWLGWLLQSVLVIDSTDKGWHSKIGYDNTQQNIPHLFICWSCNDSSIVSKLILYFSLPNRSVMSSAPTYAHIHLHILFHLSFQTLLFDSADSIYLGSASSDSWGTASWSPLSPTHCAPLAVEQAASRQATQPPAALEGKSPSRERWWGGRLLPPTIWDRQVLAALFTVCIQLPSTPTSQWRCRRGVGWFSGCSRCTTSSTGPSSANTRCSGRRLPERCLQQTQLQLQLRNAGTLNVLKGCAALKWWYYVSIQLSQVATNWSQTLNFSAFFLDFV